MFATLPLPLAFDPGDIIGGMVGLVAVCIPIVAILVGHQRKMAEIMADQQRAIIDLENRKLDAARTAAPAVDVHAQYELQTMRDRLAQMEAKLAATESQRISS